MSAEKAHIKKTENIICELKKIQALLRSTCMKCAAESPSSYFTVGGSIRQAVGSDRKDRIGCRLK